MPISTSIINICSSSNHNNSNIRSISNSDSCKLINTSYNNKLAIVTTIAVSVALAVAVAVTEAVAASNTVSIPVQ